MKFKETFAQFALQIRSVMGKLTPAQRLSLGLLAGVVAVSFVILIVINMASTGGTYENLFYQPLDAERQAYVIQKLGTEDYKIEDGKIMVRKVDKLRLSALFMQDKQVFAEKDWYASLFESNLMDTDSLRDKKFIIASANQLSAEIGYFDQVKRANVNINPGDSTTYFNDDVRRATAAVMVELKPGVTKLSQDTVNSIAGAVACSVKGLSPENISISDYSGRNYRPSVNKDNAPSDNERLEITSAISEHYENKIRQLLDYDGLCVAFYPNINWRKIETSETTHGKQETATYTAHTLTQTGGSDSTGGVAGVTPNVESVTGANTPIEIPTGGPAMGGGESESSLKETDILPYPDTDTKIEHILQNPGEVDDRMVSVSIPYNILATPISGGPAPTDPVEAEKVVQSNIERIKKQIMPAIGLAIDDPKNEAKVHVDARHAIEAPEITTAALGESFWEYSKPLLGKAAIAMFALVSLVLVATFVKRNIPKPQQIPIEEIEEKIEKEVEKEKKDFLSDMDKLDDKELKALQVKERVQEMIDENAESAANLLKSWIQKES